MKQSNDKSIRRPTSIAPVTVFYRDQIRTKQDTVIAEEPLEIRLHNLWSDPKPFATILRTPGNDFELATGFLFSQGEITSKDDIHTICYCNLSEDELQSYNIVTVTLRTPLKNEAHKSKWIDSACGACGNTSIQEIENGSFQKNLSTIRIDASTVFKLPSLLRKNQQLFTKTGSVHAAGVFTQTGNAEFVREDVGRHNAVDKVLGACILANYKKHGESILALSGRIAFELVQKTSAANIPIIVAIGAPSSLAISLAKRAGITLCGFATQDTFNVYTYPERITNDPKL